MNNLLIDVNFPEYIGEFINIDSIRQKNLMHFSLFFRIGSFTLQKKKEWQ